MSVPNVCRFFKIPPPGEHTYLSNWIVPTNEPVRDMHPLADFHASQTKNHRHSAKLTVALIIDLNTIATLLECGQDYFTSIFRLPEEVILHESRSF